MSPIDLQFNKIEAIQNVLKYILDTRRVLNFISETYNENNDNQIKIHMTIYKTDIDKILSLNEKSFEVFDVVSKVESELTSKLLEMFENV